jgi:hypothetical protein
MASACKHDGVEFDMSLMDFANSLTPEEFSHIYMADGAVSRQLGTYAYACGNNHTAVCKEKANAHGLLPFPWEKKKPEHTKVVPAISKENALKRFEKVLGKAGNG